MRLYGGTSSLLHPELTLHFWHPKAVREAVKREKHQTIVLRLLRHCKVAHFTRCHTAGGRGSFHIHSLLPASPPQCSRPPQRPWERHTHTKMFLCRCFVVFSLLTCRVLLRKLDVKGGIIPEMLCLTWHGDKTAFVVPSCRALMCPDLIWEWMILCRILYCPLVAKECNGQKYHDWFSDFWLLNYWRFSH